MLRRLLKVLKTFLNDSSRFVEVFEESWGLDWIGLDSEKILEVMKDIFEHSFKIR